MTESGQRRPDLDPEVLTPGVTTLTANNRLSRQLLLLAAGRQDQSAWETPDILPWTAWLQRSWEGALLQAPLRGAEAPGLLLGAEQALALWERIIAASPAGQYLLQIPAAARQAREAHGLRHAWRLGEISGAGAGRDVGAFLDWSARYQAQCRRHGWIDEAVLPDLLAAWFASGLLAVPPALHWAGFDEYTPQQEALMATLAAAGCRITGSASGESGSVVRHALADAEAEIIAAARWARSQLETRPELRIGIVVPELTARRAQVARLFSDVLQPSAISPDHDPAAAPLFNLSAGVALAAAPVVHDALCVLRLARGVIDLAEAGALLRSPFIAAAEQECGPRALLDVMLRERGDERIALEALQADAAQGVKGRAVCPRLAERLAALQRAAGDLARASLRPSQWAERLLALLRVVGWPGERALDSDEYQAVEAWRDLVAGLSRFDAVLAPQDLAAILDRLQRLADERMFQPERAETPIQILGVLEATGLSFDRLWVMGLHDEAWPTAPDPNPFLPLSLQRRLGLPRCSPARELEVAERLLARLCAAAPEVRLSHPLAEGDRVLRPSPLIDACPLVKLNDADPRADFWLRQIFTARGAGCLETLEDFRGPAITGEHAGGGSQLFRLQALCPFAAFARLRLQVKPLAEAAPGLDAADRGILLHRTLERLWQDLGSQQALLALDEAALRARLTSHVDSVLADAARRRPAVFTARFRELERHRLVARVLEWLEIERQRSPFTVEAMEQHASVNAGGVTVDVVIDRIDRLEDGSQAIIDYKTGNVSTRQWFGDRPEEPQLPLYSLLSGEGLGALMFARLRPGATACIGVARDAGVAPGVKPFAETAEGRSGADWDEMLADWRRVLEGLGEDFRAGLAIVDPKSLSTSCAYCGLTALCRINESTSPVDDVAVIERGQDGAGGEG